MDSHVWEDLILAILSVNRYSLEKTYSTLESLRREGLFDPQQLARWKVEEITTRLRRGGYDRGEFLTKLLAERLMSLGVFVEQVGVEESQRLLTNSDETKIRDFLKSVKGVGPQVLSTFSMLRQGGS
jgi:endonuclease III-like uncharacterized protein